MVATFLEPESKTVTSRVLMLRGLHWDTILQMHIVFSRQFLAVVKLLSLRLGWGILDSSK